MAKCTPKQKRFIDEYLIDMNGTQAAIRAGYSQRTARHIAMELLAKPHIQALLQEKQRRLQIKTEITAERVLNEIAAIAFADSADYAQATDDLNVHIVPTKDLTETQRKAIASIKAGRNGVEVKTHDKIRALELLSKHLGLFEDNQQKEAPSTNIFEAINACDEEGLDEIPEVQQAAEDDAALVENG